MRRSKKNKNMTEADKTAPEPAGPAVATPMRGDVVEEFARSSRVVEDRDQLRLAFAATVRLLGFDHFALQGEGARLLLADLPANWIFRPDPERDIVFAAAARSLSPFLWSDIPRLTPLSPADARAVETAPPGFAVPLHGSPFSSALVSPPGLAGARGFVGCCSFLVRKGAALPVEISPPPWRWMRRIALTASSRCAPA